MNGIDNLGQFDTDLKAFAVKTQLQLGVVVKRIVIDLMRRVVIKTPVDTGRAAGSWILAKGESDDSTVLPNGQYGPPDALAAAVTAAGAVSFDPPEGVYWLSNNLPYIQVLEFGLYPSGGKGKPSGKTVGGFSVQAPQGMVRISVAEVESDLYEMEGVSEA